jgi:hypothetical protein
MNYHIEFQKQLIRLTGSECITPRAKALQLLKQIGRPVTDASPDVDLINELLQLHDRP